MDGGCIVSNFFDAQNVFHSCTISNSKTNEKQKMKETTLDLSLNILVLQTMSSPFSFFFWFRPIEFPSKMMPCRWTLNYIELVSNPHLKAFGHYGSRPI
jgi:hypothetical protein